MMNVAHFTSGDVQHLFEDKHVVVIGDSVQRSVYKDLVCLLRDDELLTLEELKEKGEESFQEDTLLEGGVKSGLHNGTHYREVRKYEQGDTTIMFYFVTRCYGEYMQSILDNFKLDPPHVIIMNSCLWDLHRYGKTANDEFITNISELLAAIDLAVPYEDSLFIWNATLPVREKVKAGFLPPGVGHTLPAEDIRKANLYVRDQMNTYGERFIFLDLHKTFYTHLDLRVKDGVHWNDFAHRKITCLILSEISKHWNIELPSKLPMSPAAGERASHSVNSDRSMDDVRHHPRPLLEIPHPSNGHMAGINLSPMMNNDFPGPFTGHNALPRGNATPRGNVRPRGNAPRGPRDNGPSGLRFNMPLRPNMNGRPGNIPIRNPPPGNVAMRDYSGRASIGRRARKRGGHNPHARNRSHPPAWPWQNSPPVFMNNNEFTPPGFPLNETYPPCPTKRKFIDEEEFRNAYKFPRKL